MPSLPRLHTLGPAAPLTSIPFPPEGSGSPMIHRLSNDLLPPLPGTLLPHDPPALHDKLYVGRLVSSSGSDGGQHRSGHLHLDLDEE